jgi:NADH:ubiquinone oxidoreductase subunit 2 (subunit N)
MAVATVIGLAYYLKWGAQLFKAEAPSASRPRGSVRSHGSSTVAVVLCLVVTIALSFAPSLALGLVERL